MIINHNNDYTEYICSLCGHKHIEYADGTKENDCFIPYNRKVKIHKPIEEETRSGKEWDLLYMNLMLSFVLNAIKFRLTLLNMLTILVTEF